MLKRLLASPRFYFVVAGLLLAGALGTQFQRSGDPRPMGGVEALDALAKRDDLNVVFVMIDTLRADRLSAYGYHRPTSPTLDALAAGGIRFDKVVAQSSWTKCSMASLWTGTHPVRNGILRYPHALPEEATLPAEIFQAAGFRTAGIWRNGWVDPSFGFGQGFDVYVKPRSYEQRKREPRRRSPYALVGNDWVLTESALAFLKSFRDERFFLYLHYMDVHQYVSDKTTPKFGTSYSDIYDSAIAWTDRNVAALVGALQAEGLFDRTVIVITSDHGEEFREHGGEGHARTLYREVTEVPWIISLPFLLERGVVVEERVENVDVWPTLLDLLGLPPLPHADGRSLLPEIRAAVSGAAPSEPEPDDDGELAVAYLDQRWGRVGAKPRPLLAVHHGRYRLIHRPESPERDELFDVAADPHEQENRAEALPDVLSRMQALAGEQLARPLAAWGAPKEIELSGFQLQLLRALGYAVGGQVQEREGAEGAEPGEAQRR